MSHWVLAGPHEPGGAAEDHQHEPDGRGAAVRPHQDLGFRPSLPVVGRLLLRV